MKLILLTVSRTNIGTHVPRKHSLPVLKNMCKRKRDCKNYAVKGDVVALGGIYNVNTKWRL